MDFISGSISITHHIVSPLSRGLFKSAVKTNSLFRRGICQSGTCFYPGAYFSPEQSRKFLLKRLPAMGKLLQVCETVSDLFRRLAFLYRIFSINIMLLFLGCTSTDSKEILEFLQFVPAEEIVKHLALLSYPVKDDARCPEPFEAYETGTFNPVDLMVNFFFFVFLVATNSVLFRRLTRHHFPILFAHDFCGTNIQITLGDVLRLNSNNPPFRLASRRMKVQTLYLIWLEDSMLTPKSKPKTLSPGWLKCKFY